MNFFKLNEKKAKFKNKNKIMKKLYAIINERFYCFRLNNNYIDWFFVSVKMKTDEESWHRKYVARLNDERGFTLPNEFLTINNWTQQQIILFSFSSWGSEIFLRRNICICINFIFDVNNLFYFSVYIVYKWTSIVIARNRCAVCVFYPLE